ncbi:MAG: PH domain-containing protein [Planctomycetes bacterium]|nr:PH domain-containing protein [Planctomycetota bacterium]
MEIIDEAAFCHRCGAPLGEERLEPTPRERLQGAIGDKRPDSDPPEQQLWQGSFSKLAMIGWWIGAAVFTLALLVVAVVGGFGGRGWLISLAILLLVWAGLVVRLLYLQLSRHYFLSNQRFVHERGLLWRETDRIETIDIDDVSFVQGPLERMLGVGAIRILSSDQSHPTLELPGIENVHAVAALIDETRRQERRRRGLYVESV